MGTFADSLFAALMSWVRALVSSIWALFTSENTTLLGFLGEHWLVIAVVIIAAGLALDWLIWLIRWRPYHLWAIRIRRLLGIVEEDDDEEDEQEAAARARYAEDWGDDAQDDDDMRIYARPSRERAAQEDWLPLPPQTHSEERIGEAEEEPGEEIDEEQAISSAQSVPDEALGQYPGRLYSGASAQLPPDERTQRFSAVHAEGPGAAEVARRRAEIDAWQLQMKEEAAARVQAERAAAEAEQARLAKEAYEAEQARLAQEEYERQLEEYERQKAQYERDLAQYERQKAEYDAQMAAFHAPKDETAQEIAPQGRRRRAARTYSDYVQGETVSSLPETPEWPQIQEAEVRQAEQTHKNGLLSRMAHMIEPQEEEIARVTSLPPRVDVKSAYKPAKRPPKG